MRQLSEVLKAGFIEVYARLGFVGKTQLNQPLNLADDLWNVLRCAGIIVDIRDA